MNAPRQDPDAWTQEIHAAERRRAQALVSGDWASLEPMLDPGLIYVHAPGVVHRRAALLDFLRSGPRFLEVGLAIEDLRREGDVALVYGVLHMRLQRGESAPVEARSFVTQAWVLRPRGWLLAMFQSTRVPDPAPGR